MKDSFYFQHDYNARNDERILQIRAEHGLPGYGLYFMLLESMAESGDGYLSLDGMAGLSLSYGSAIEQLKALILRCIELGLFHEVKGRFSSKRMIEYKNFRKERSESGRRGANNRWGDSSAIAQPLAKSKTANTKDSIGKDSIEQKRTEKENKKAAFTKPSVEEVKAYCLERKNSVDPDTFWNFYESKGWKVGSTPMKSWTSAMVTWEKRSPATSSPGGKRYYIQENGKEKEVSKSEYEAIKQRKNLTPSL